MGFATFTNYLFVPGSDNQQEGKLYELEEASGFEKNSLVLIPYTNPQKKSTKPRYLKISRVAKIPPQSSTAELNPKFHLRAKTSRQDYLKKVKQLKQHIQEGNIYEINFCVQFFAENIAIDPLSVFLRLHALSKAPYSALLKLGSQYIISSSPELFLKKVGNLLSTKPIKGTIRRGVTKDEDERLKDELFYSIKERTENVMAVDVARNDLSIIAAKGSVHVNKLYNIESFETVHQMVSSVSCLLKENTSFENILDATFPMASMTGAPKNRAMQLIDEFEDIARGPYSGAMGLIDENEDFELSVIIRSIFYDEAAKTLSINVGSAITYLSDSEEEYKECLLKAKALLTALNAQLP